MALSYTANWLHCSVVAGRGCCGGKVATASTAKAPAAFLTLMASSAYLNSCEENSLSIASAIISSVTKQVMLSICDTFSVSPVVVFSVVMTSACPFQVSLSVKVMFADALFDNLWKKSMFSIVF